MDSHLCRFSLAVEPLKCFETLVMYTLTAEATMRGAMQCFTTKATHGNSILSPANIYTPMNSHQEQYMGLLH